VQDGRCAGRIVALVPDDLFALPRLARIYDELDGPRVDLEHYHAIVDELGATSVLDVGCGTGTFACQLSQRGLRVIGIDPAEASLEVAMSKPGAEHVRWVLAKGSAIPEADADVATMTGNVAQVFLDDVEWTTVLGSIRRALQPTGHLVLEAREPSRRAWEDWTREATCEVLDLTAEGRVQHWVELTNVALPYVSFRHHYVFERDGVELASDSTLRFRSCEEIERSLEACGFTVIDIRNAPDRPGHENVVIARTIP
jgi:ubiquinone/menaquinone biosynthesis C-methylase UbiE